MWASSSASWVAQSSDTARASRSSSACSAGESGSGSAATNRVTVSVPQVTGVESPTPRGSHPTRSNRRAIPGLKGSSSTSSTPEPPGPPGLATMVPIRSSAGPAAVRRATASSIVAPSGRDQSSGTTRVAQLRSGSFGSSSHDAHRSGAGRHRAGSPAVDGSAGWRSASWSGTSSDPRPDAALDGRGSESRRGIGSRAPLHVVDDATRTVARTTARATTRRGWRRRGIGSLYGWGHRAPTRGPATAVVFSG